MINIYKASPDDAVLITELARKIYQEHYLHLWHAGGAQWYMEEYAYAKEKIEMELADNNIEYFIAEEDGAYLGYMKIVLAAALAGDESMHALEVERIYLYKKATGKGIGKKFMLLAQQIAHQLKKDIIFLKAMDSSTGALEFYKKMGYSICGNLTLPLPVFQLMKKEYRGMVILKRKIEA